MMYRYLSIICILLSSCSYRTIDMNSPQPIVVAANEKFRINLPEDHRTGYTWQLNDTYDATIIDHTNTVWEGNSNGIFFYFKSGKAGSTVLNFTSRKFDDVNSVKEMSITVTEK